MHSELWIVKNIVCLYSISECKMLKMAPNELGDCLTESMKRAFCVMHFNSTVVTKHLTPDWHSTFHESSPVPWSRMASIHSQFP